MDSITPTIVSRTPPTFFRTPANEIVVPVSEDRTFDNSTPFANSPKPIMIANASITPPRLLIIVEKSMSTVSNISE